MPVVKADFEDLVGGNIGDLDEVLETSYYSRGVGGGLKDLQVGLGARKRAGGGVINWF